MKIKPLFCVFLRKNALFLQFNCFSLLLNFLGILCCLWIYLRSTAKEVSIHTIVYDAKSIDFLKERYFPANDEDLVFYGPETELIKQLMNNVRQELEMPTKRLVGFSDATEMRLQMERSCQGYCFAVYFTNYPANGSDGALEFSISSNAMSISPKKRYVNDEEVCDVKDDDDYLRSGFLTLQGIINRQYQRIRSTQDNYYVDISAIPTVEKTYMDSNRIVYFGTIYSVLLNVLLLSTFLVPVVEEKQNGLKEFLVIATPLNFMNGLTFFILRWIIYVVLLLIVITLGIYYKALGIIPLFYITVLFMLHMIAAMSYAYLISVCFNSVFYAKVGGLVMLILPHIFYGTQGAFSTFTSYLLCTKTFMSGLDVFQIFTNKHRDFRWSDLNENITDGSFQMSSIYAIFIIQSICYAILYNYLSHIFPGPGGLKKPFLFFLKPSFYKKPHRNQYTTSERGTDAIIVQDLVKKFKTPRGDINISDRLNMIIKNKQITVLLGHNGAGKTTTLNMIMGSVPKDSGKIIVCCERDVSSYRHLIGLCPQHSVFMHYMTCSQHLQFFGQLRGMTEKEAKNLTDTLLRQLNLIDKANEYGKNLSGGMKRRLSLGIAITGDTKVIVLDEPSSGLDIESRRELWDILLELRKTKAILVTTHHMEEAEVLGDTICILANGRLQRVGSPLELKRKVGTGYILKICTDSSSYKESETLQLLQNYVPKAKVLTIVPPTVLVSLPYDNRKIYSQLLLQLEKLQHELGIESFSITDTTMEDVFLNCANEVDEIDSPDHRRTNNTNIPYQQLNTPKQVAWHQQFNAIFYKRIIYLQNDWIYSTFMLLLPYIGLSLTIILMNNMSIGSNDGVLPLNLGNYKNGIVYWHSPNNGTSELKNILKQELTKYNVKLENLWVHDNATVVEELISMQKKNLAYFLQNVIGVIDVEEQEQQFHIYFSGNVYHSSATMLNLLDDALLKLKTNANNHIAAIYVPTRRIITEVSPSRLEYYAVIMPISMFFFMFYFIKLPFVESESGFKDLQTVPRLVYWLANLSFDLLVHLTMCLCLFSYQKALLSHELYNSHEQFLIMSSIFFYGLSYLPLLYIFANNFRSISTISTYLLMMLIVSSIMPHITSNNLQSMIHHETAIWFLSFLPDFNWSHQLRIINENFILMRQNKHSLRGAAIGADYKNTTNDVVLTRGTFFLYAITVFGLGFLFFVHVLENKYKRNFFNGTFARNVSQANDVDDNESDAVEERHLVKSILDGKDENNYPLLVSGLSKSYNRKTRVVKNLNFAVRKKECFGLLGVNGAGKTSTFQMIAANIPITCGTIKIDGYDILQNETKYRNRFGYCPQHDALNKFMTSYQMLRYIGELRGLGGQQLENEITYWLEQLNLEKYRNVAIQYYSGGTKRKLNAAMAMIGGPSLVLLDEPTTGVDPISRRLLWKCIQDFQKRDKTIVLTSHSMDECEQLCNRLAIMADGKFKCIGHIPILKKRFGCGFTIAVKMKEPLMEENVNTIKYAMHNQFPDCELRENHAGMLTFFIKEVNGIVWSSVFKRAEQFSYECSNWIDDYSVNETKLEDIFLKFNNRRTSNIPTTSGSDMV